MIYIHESNLLNKIRNNYNYKSEKIKSFYNEIYLEYRKKLQNLDYSSEDIEVFKKAAMLIDEYLIEIENFSSIINITSQSKFRSTFIEEISSYLFAKLPLIENDTFGIFNKNIFAGMKINNQMRIDIIPKDVDFCIGKKVFLKLDTAQELNIIIPIVCIEVKTYLDATMFGEVQYSSKQIKNASPNVKTYVLMEYNDVSKEKIISARYDNNLNEMFVLRGGSRKDNILETPMDAKTLLKYYCEIRNVVDNTDLEDEIIVPGKLLNPEETEN
ncbi:MAG: Bpu10I family restriction endonuclease [Clostridia bacterium]|nr:Bpu10I family restriction endonuclease [Clostridia bacterium]